MNEYIYLSKYFIFLLDFTWQSVFVWRNLILLSVDQVKPTNRFPLSSREFACKLTLLLRFTCGGNVERKFCVMYPLEWCILVFECCFVRAFGVHWVYMKEDYSVEAVSILFVKFAFLRRSLGRRYCCCCKNTQPCSGSDNAGVN